MLVDKQFIYSFGGACNDQAGLNKGLEIERLDTFKAGTPQAKWNMFNLKSDYLKCCQQGVIRLKNSSMDEKRFLIFGGVFHTFIN
jgi:hypothetical protein